MKNRAVSRLAKWDIAGMGLSVACGIHCLATPILLSALPLLGVEIMGHNHQFEALMVGLIAVLAGVTYIRGFLMHERLGHFILGFVGLAIFLVVRPAIGHSHDHSLEHLATVLGGFAFVLGHYLNWKWSKPCENCGEGH